MIPKDFLAILTNEVFRHRTPERKMIQKDIVPIEFLIPERVVDLATIP